MALFKRRVVTPYHPQYWTRWVAIVGFAFLAIYCSGWLSELAAPRPRPQTAASTGFAAQQGRATVRPGSTGEPGSHQEPLPAAEGAPAVNAEDDDSQYEAPHSQQELTRQQQEQQQEQQQVDAQQWEQGAEALPLEDPDQPTPAEQQERPPWEQQQQPEEQLPAAAAGVGPDMNGAQAAGKQAAAAAGTAGLETTAAAAAGGTSAGASAAAAAAAAADTSAGPVGAEPSSQQLSVCADTCPSAKDGKCDEGRPNKGEQPLLDGVYAVTCDLGTDCQDCGPWEFSGSPEALEWRPVHEIRSKQFAVNVRLTGTPQPYWMAYTDPQQDVDVSASMQGTRLVEPGITSLWYRILKQGCVGPEGERRLVLDVGANFGYYTLLAASMGCRVIAWEPVPLFASFLQYGLLRNNLTDRVQVRSNIVGDEAGRELTIVVPQRGIWGTAGVDGMNIDRAIDNKGDYGLVVRAAERLDQAVQEDVLLMKVDVEGFEPHVLKSATGLLLGSKIDNIIMEYSPGVAERHQNWDLFEANPSMLVRLVNAGYTALHLTGLPSPGAAPGGGWDAPLPALEVVVREALQHDLEDAARLRANSLGCPLPRELVGKRGMWGCNTLPEPLHPHSFRATFGHNTNLWLVRDESPSRALAHLGAPASLFPFTYPLTKYFTPHGLGMARRPCAALEPAVQVMHRCPCTDTSVCGELAELVSRLAQQGKVPPLKPPPRTANPDQLLLSTW